MSNKYKVYTIKEFRNLLKDNGFALARCKGDHEIWKNKSRERIISVPIIDFNPIIARRLIKEHELRNVLEQRTEYKMKVLHQLRIYPTEQEKAKINSAISVSHLDRICRDIINSRD